jgi:hypothetical protein
VIRLSQQTSLPQHHESIPLRGPVRLLGWTVALGSIGLGFYGAAVTEGAVARIVGPIGVIVGGVALAAVWQCRKYELTVGTVRIEIGTGPFRDTLATGAVESMTLRPATGWRRCFATDEVVLGLEVGRRPSVPIPTLDPTALRAALE